MSSAAARSGEVFIVADDAALRDKLSRLFGLHGFEARGFADGETVLEAARTEIVDALLLDVNLPGRSGLEVLKELHTRAYPAPVFMISGQIDVANTVTAMRHGAVDFLEKPIDGDAVVRRVREAIDTATHLHLKRILSWPFRGHHRLTPREHEVLAEIASGASNKEIGIKLGISPRTIEVHRARIMEKVAAKNAADLVRIVLSRPLLA